MKKINVTNSSDYLLKRFKKKIQQKRKEKKRKEKEKESSCIDTPETKTKNAQG
jgi:hypothetical protein